jgi:hypothetical protein
LYTYLYLGLPSGTFLSGFPTNMHLPYSRYMPCPSHPQLVLIILATNFVETQNISKSVIKTMWHICHLFCYILYSRSYLHECLSLGHIECSSGSYFTYKKLSLSAIASHECSWIIHIFAMYSRTHDVIWEVTSVLSSMNTRPVYVHS